MTVDASRSCLGLGTCVGSTIRQIVEARVLLTATAPPALPGRSVSDGSLAPPLNAIMRLLRSGRHHRYLSGNGPDEASQLAGDCGGDDIGRLASSGELAIAGAQPKLSFPGSLTDRLRLALLPQQQLAAEPGREPVGPCALDQYPASRVIARLGDTAAFDAGAARMLGWHEAEIGHELAWVGEAREITEFGDERCSIDQRHAAHRLQRCHD